MGRFTELVRGMLPQAPLGPDEEARLRAANPDQAAEAQRLAVQTRLPTSTIGRNLPEVQAQAQVGRFTQFLRDNPPDVGRLGDDFNAVAKDDTEQLDGIRRLLGLHSMFRRPALAAGRAARTLGTGSLRFATNIATGTTGFLWDLVPGEYASEQAAGVRRLQRQVNAQLDTWSGAADPNAGTLERGIYAGIESMGANLPPLLGAAAMRNPGAALSAMGTMVFGQEYSRARDEGLGVTQSAIYGGGQASVEALFELVPVGRLFGDLAKDTGFVKLLTRQLAAEIPGEQATTLVQDLFEWSVLNPERPLQEYIDARPGAAVETLIATIVGTGGQTAAVAGLDAALRTQAEQAEVHADAIKEFSGLVEASKLKERSPEQFRRYVDTLAPDGELYVDAEDMQQVLEQTEMEVPADIAERAAEALQTNTPVRISVAELGTYFNDQVDFLSERIRVGTADAMNVEEAKAIDQEFNARAERVMAEAENSEQLRAEGQSINEAVRAQIMSSGRFREDVASAYSSLVESFFVTQAARLGVSPQELFERYPLRVQAADTTEGALEQTAPQFNVDRGSADGVRIAFGEPHTRGGFIELNYPDATTAQIKLTEVSESLRGRGLGQQLVEQAYAEAQRTGRVLVSDRAVSDMQLRVYDALARKGWTFDTNSNIERIEGGVRSNEGLPIFTNIKPPSAEYLQQSAQVQDAALRPVAALAADAAPQVPAGYSRFRHFGNVQTPVLDPKFMGTGMRGEESRRGGPRVISLYPDTGFQKESGVGPHEYVVDIPSSQLYDANKDPEGFIELASEPTSFTIGDNGEFIPAGEMRLDMDAFEQLIKDAGYTGYVTPAGDGNLRGQARVFSEIPVIASPQETLFQLEPGTEPAGWEGIDPFLSPEEREVVTTRNAQQMIDTFNSLDAEDFAAAADAGRAARGWYDKANRAIRAVFGDSDAPRFAGLVASLSPQTDVHTNLKNAVIVWTAWDQAGRPTNENEVRQLIFSALEESYGKPLPAWLGNGVKALTAEDPTALTLSGPKVNAFMRNLYGDVSAVTNDTWMARFALLDPAADIGGKGGNRVRPKYIALAAKVREAAKLLTERMGTEWTPAQVQETVWSWIKSAFELADAAGLSIADAVESGEVSDESIAAVPALGQMLADDESIVSILEEAGYGEQIRALSDVGLIAADSREAGPSPRLIAIAKRLDAQRAQAETLNQDDRLPGLPESSPGGVPAIREAAERYMAESGIESGVPPQDRYVMVDRERATRIANEYEKAKHEPNDPEVQAAYTALIAETVAQYHALAATGLKIEFITGENPYSEGPKQVHEDLRRGHLWVFPTDSGFGQQEAPNHPLLAPTDIVIGGRQLLANDVFRIVHDVFGHGLAGAGFGPIGEENAFQAHMRMYSPLAARAMTTETRGQNSWVNFGPHGEANRANQKATIYAEQKATLLPEWVTYEGVREEESGETVRMYHGFPVEVMDSVRAEGIKASDRERKRGATFVSPKPDIAFAYVEKGGEKSNRGVRRRPVVPDAERALAVLEIPVEWYRQHVVQEHGDAYPEAGFDTAIPAEFIKDIVVGDRQAVYALPESKLMRDRETVEQRAKGQIRMGRDITASPSIVTLFETADLSTFLHESGHFFLEVMADLAARPDAPAAIQQDMQTLLGWFGYKGSISEWRNLSVSQRRDAHEKFARGFESWLMEGNAPSAELRMLFHRFRAWLVNLYKNALSLNVELTDEVRSVMASMVASADQIQAATESRNLMPLFDAPTANMTPEQWAQYQADTGRAVEHATDELQVRSLRNLRLLDNARAKELKRLQKENADKRTAVRAEVEAEVAAMPVRKAETLIRDGEVWVEGPDGQPQQVKIDGPHKLSTDALAEAYGTREEHRAMAEAAGIDPAAARAPWQDLPQSLLAKDGLTADEVAELTGFTSGDQLIRELLDMPPRDELIERLTDRRMFERHGDLNNPTTLQRAVDIAVHNQHRQRVVSAELAALDETMRARPGGVTAVRNAARDHAQRVVARRRIRDLRPTTFTAAETRAAREAQKALAAGDMRLAATRKRDQLFNGYASREASKAAEEIERGLAYLRRFTETGTRKNLDPGYRDQIDRMLERFDLRRRSLREVDKRATLAEWIKQQEEDGIDPAIPDELRDEANRKNYQQMTVEEFRGLVDSVKSIAHLARLKKKLLAAAEQRDFDQAVTELVESIEENAPTGKPKQQLEKDLSLWGRFSDTMNEWLTHLRKLGSITRQIDGGKDGGRFWEYMLRPLNAASDKEVRMRADATKRLNALMNSLPALKRSYLRKVGQRIVGPEKLFIPEINRSLSLEARLAVALNWGNDGNRQRIMDGNQWTEAQAQAVIDTLTKEEMDFVQAVWDYIGEFWPEIAAKEQRVTGVTPERVESTPVMWRGDRRQGGGAQYRGGYYPIVADAMRSERAAQQNDAELIGQALRGAVTRATTRRGHTKARVGGKDPVRLDLGVLTQHVGQVIHDLAWHEALIDAGRLLRNSEVSGALRENYGAEVTKLIRRTLDDTARGEVAARDAGERLANHFRIGATIAGLGLSVTTTLLQPTGLTQSFQRIGYRHVARGLVQFIANPAESIRRVREASSFMRDRGTVMNRELGEIMNTLRGTSQLTSLYFFPIQAMQTAVDVPTWLGAYDKAIEADESHERAVYLADQAVRDSQASGHLHDLSEVQRGSAYKKLLTNFYSYFNATYNLAAESVQQFNRERSVMASIKLGTDFLMLFVVPAFLGMLIRDGLRNLGDDDEPEAEELAKELGRETASYLLGTLPYFRELGGAVQGFEYRGPAGLGFLAHTSKAIAQAQQGELDEPLLRALNQAAGTAFHYPANQVDRTVRGLIAISEGEAGPQAILTGPPRKE